MSHFDARRPLRLRIGAISNELIGDGSCFVPQADPEKKGTLHLSGPAFIVTFFLICCQTFKRIRHYAQQDQRHGALAVPAPEPAVIESVADFMRRVADIDWTRCPHCACGRFVVTAGITPQRLQGPLAHGPP
ncbi:MAG: hypothetical protein IPI21_08845 [Propionivibrio sp.]|nr:hypothetical protein [Propionivibrio sp.]